MKTTCQLMVMVALLSAPLLAQSGEEGKRKKVPLLRDLPLLSSSFQQKPEPQEKKPGKQVPVLQDIPLLGFMFKNGAQGPRDWFPFPGGADTDPDAVPSGPRARELWLMKQLRGLHPELTAVRLVEKRVWRFDEEGKRRLDRQRGLETYGAKPALQKARRWLEGFFAGQSGLLLRSEFRLVMRGPAKEHQSPAVRLLGEDELRRAFKEQVKGQISFPALTTKSGQRANASIMRQIAYIKDYDVEVTSASFIADPVVDVVKDGISIDLEAFVLPASNEILVRTAILVSALKRPLKTFKTTLAGQKEELEIQLPELSTLNWKAEEIRIQKGTGGFVVEGLSGILPGNDRSLRAFDLYCRVEPIEMEESAETPLGGTVSFVDPRGHHVTVSWSDPGQAAPIGTHKEARLGDEKAVLRAVSGPGELQIFRIEKGSVTKGARVF